jgi:hypothetical protein
MALVWPPNARDVTAERSGTIMGFVGAQFVQKAATATFIADAAADPTTFRFRRALHDSVTMTLRQLRARIRTLVLDDDMLGLGGKNITAMAQRQDDRMAAFTRCLITMVAQAFDGVWLELHVTKTWVAARNEVGASREDAPTPPDATTNANDELHGMLLGALGVETVIAARQAVETHMTAAAAWRKIGAAYDKATKNRARAFADTVVARTYQRATEEAHRQLAAQSAEGDHQ